MKLNLPPFQVRSAIPAHKQIADYLEGLILKGDLAPATRLPPTTELAREWNASYLVIHKALAQLSRAGRCRGRGADGVLEDVGSRRL